MLLIVAAPPRFIFFLIFLLFASRYADTLDAIDTGIYATLIYAFRQRLSPPRRRSLPLFRYYAADISDQLTRRCRRR